MIYLIYFYLKLNTIITFLVNEFKQICSSNAHNIYSAHYTFMIESKWKFKNLFDLFDCDSGIHEKADSFTELKGIEWF